MRKDDISHSTIYFKREEGNAVKCKPSFKIMSPGICYLCDTAACYLVKFKIQFCFLESDFRLTVQRFPQEFSTLSSFFKKYKANINILQIFDLETTEKRKIDVLQNWFSLLSYRSSLQNSHVLPC